MIKTFNSLARRFVVVCALALQDSIKRWKGLRLEVGSNYIRYLCIRNGHFFRDKNLIVVTIEKTLCYVV